MSKCICNVVLNPFTNDSRVLKTSMSLAKAGHSVTVVAMHEPGLPEVEELQGIRVLRIRIRTRALPRNPLTRMLSFAEFMLRALPKVTRANVLHCNDLGALVMGNVWKAIAFRQVRLVYDSHEFAMNDSAGETALRMWLKRRLEQLCIHAANRVICVSPSIVRAYHAIHRIPRPTLVLNCPPSQDVVRSDLIRTTLGLREDQRIFLYQGRLTSGRGIELLMDSFQARQADQDVIVFMGNGPITQVVSERAATCPRIRILPAVPPQELLRWTASADYGVCFIEDSCLSYRYCLPNKLFEYMMAGIPVLASNTIDVRRLVEKEGIGVVAKENSVAGFDEALDRLLQTDPSKWRENARRASATFCWEQQEARLGELLDRVTGSLAAEP